MRTAPASLAAGVVAQLALAGAGCTGGGKYPTVDSGAAADDDDDGPTDTTDGSVDDDCGETPPTLSDLSCDYPGLGAPEPGLDDVPMIQLFGQAADVDGDLHYRATRITWDGPPLGELDLDTAMVKERPLSRASDKPCETTEGRVTDKLYLNPELGVDYGAEYDFGMQVSDATGRWSDMVLITCALPLEDGTAP